MSSYPTLTTTLCGRSSLTILEMGQHRIREFRTLPKITWLVSSESICATVGYTATKRSLGKILRHDKGWDWTSMNLKEANPDRWRTSWGLTEKGGMQAVLQSFWNLKLVPSPNCLIRTCWITKRSLSQGDHICKKVLSTTWLLRMRL